MTAAIKNEKRKTLLFGLIKDLITEKSLDEYDFRQLDVFLGLIGTEFRNGNISKDVISEINLGFDEEFLEATLQGRGYRKPSGYVGDYLLLDRIYTRHVTDNPKYKIWDEYFQQHAAPRAVRNRKSYFKNFIREKASQNSNLRILNIVSGSGRELLELYSELPHGHNIKTTCVEIDDCAIAYSKNLNKNHLGKLTYVHENIFKYRSTNPSDVVWVAGLFDYLEDDAYVSLLQRFYEWTNPRGEIVIGNFNERHNPSRDYMEILGDWFLVHRTKQQLFELGKKAGFADHQINIRHGKDNVILYLHLNMY